ncbi:MAG: choice-of-anchor J domain-containing protein [Bacteroidota bacterium]
MKKVYMFMTLLLISGVIFAQVQKAGSALSAVKVEKVINTMASSNTKAIIDSLHYDGANTGNAIGTGAAATIEVHAFFPAAQLTPHNALGNTITAVKVYINGVADVTSTQLKFYSNQTTVVYSQAFTPVEGWQTVTLTTPFPIPATDLYIGYEGVVTGGYPFGCDDATTAIPNGNWIVYNAAWAHLTDLNPALTGSWNIRAMVDGTAITTPVASGTPLTWNAGSIATSSSIISGTFTLTNVGGGTLTSSAITGISAPFTTTFVPASVSLAAGAFTTFTFTYSPTVVGVNNQTAVIATNGGNVSISLSGTGIACNAISIYPFSESFENNFPPDCWSLNDADGDGVNWYQNTVVYAHSGLACAASASWNGSPLTPDNYLITPQLDVTSAANIILTYWVAGQDPLWSLEHYSVMVSTTGTAPADFTEVFNETLTADTTWALRTVDLSTYGGQNIYIAFRHWNVTDQFYMRLDDINVNATVGINETANNMVSVYPNPVNNELTINNLSAIGKVKIINAVGQIVFENNIIANTYKINTSNFEKGVYMMQIESERGVITKKVIISR